MTPPAYYNEIDPYAARWLRNLIAAGHIAPGDVDERSIEDVHPDDLKPYKQCHFFAGIGVWSHALRLAGWPDDRPVWTGSCPCQPFSSAGKRAGVSDERHLWPAWYHLIKELRPSVVFGEQVASKDGFAWFDIVSADMERVDYAIGETPAPAAGFGAPHIRMRNYWVADANRTEWRAKDHRTATDDWQESRRFESSDRIGERRDFGELANAASQRRDGGQDTSRARWRVGSETDSSSGLLAYAEGARRQERGWNFDGGVSRSSSQGLEQQSGCGGIRGVANPYTDRCSPVPGTRCDTKERDAQPRRILGDAVSTRLEGYARDGDETGRRSLKNRSTTQTGPVGGFWRGAEWIYCRDEKWRAIEPGTFPLAHGAPARVGRLRAYGNAIVASQAQEFIKAFIDFRLNHHA